jgi:hypothetical protein
VADGPARNIYFELTKAFNATAPTVALASGQAVVYYRVAIMSKDGDWIIHETPEACAVVLGELEARGRDTGWPLRSTCGGFPVVGQAISSSSMRVGGGYGATSSAVLPACLGPPSTPFSSVPRNLPH